MNTKAIYLLQFLLILFAFSASAQSKRALERDAKDLFKYEDYRYAKPLYKQLLEKEPENGEFLARYGISCLYSDNKRDAIPFLLRAKDQGYTEDKVYFYLGKAFHYNHNFDKAISYFEDYKKELDMVKDEAELRMVNHQIQMCKYGKELVKAPVEVTIENLGFSVNSTYPDFVPLVSGDESTLIFTSRRPNTTGGEVQDETTHYYEDIYISQKTSDGTWGEPVHLEHNTEGHDACVSLSPNGDKLFIYKDNKKQRYSMLKKDGGDIFVSVLKGERWSKPVPMPKGINSEYSETSLSLAPNEQVLFFSSNRPGGHGGFDIYYCTIGADYSWSEPVNAGPKINTEHNEDAPFIHADGKTLYFSSEGHNSMGGYDIFTTEFNVDKNFFTAPVNIGYPINTAGDDIFFNWSADGTRAYFSSVREDGFGEKDLYMLTREAKVSLIAFKGKVFSKQKEGPVAATVKVFDNETNELVQQFSSNSASGKFLALLPPGKNYQLVVEQPGFMPYSENIHLPDQGQFYDLKKDIHLERLKAGSIANLNNVFFDLNKATLRKESFLELDRFKEFMTDNSDLYFEIAGHTDSIGSNQYNYTLSSNRAKAVVDYLVSKGVEKSRLYAVGYGEDFAVADNKTEEGRQLNRRTEIIVIEKPSSSDYPRKQGFYYNKGKK